MSLKRIAPDVVLGKDVVVRDFVNLYGCTIGDRTRIGAFVEIQKGARVGADCKISSHTFICEGVEIEDQVFVGHNVSFINDKYPRAANDDGLLQSEKDWKVIPTRVKRGASIGTSATSRSMPGSKRTAVPAGTASRSPQAATRSKDKAGLASAKW